MRAHRSTRAALALAALAAAAGCGRSRGPVEIASIRVAQGALAGPLREAGLDDAALESAAREALAASGFRLVSEGSRAWRARVDVHAVRVAAAAGRPRLEVVLAIELGPPRAGAGEPVVESGFGTAAAAGEPAAAWRQAVAAAARHAAEGLAVAFAEGRKGESQLVKDLSSRDARVREHAVRALAERGSAETVPALVERLTDEDPDVVQRAVGALARIGDRRAVGPLIALARRGDAAQAARLARIVGDIGGPEAEGYLLALEAGHPDARVRRAAREALGEMAARAEAPPAAPAR